MIARRCIEGNLCTARCWIRINHHARNRITLVNREGCYIHIRLTKIVLDLKRNGVLTCAHDTEVILEFLPRNGQFRCFTTNARRVVYN